MRHWRKSQPSHEETTTDLERWQIRKVWAAGRRTFVRQRRDNPKYELDNRMLDDAEAKRARRRERNVRVAGGVCREHNQAFVHFGARTYGCPACRVH